jgi:hypothetical protein
MTNAMSLDRRDFFGLALGGLALGLAAVSPRAARAQATGAKLKIATIGAGREGGALGTLFAKEGHPVMFSSRNPDSLKDLVASAGPNAKAGTVAEAVAFGDVVLIAVPYTAMEQIAKDYGPALATKQLVFDVSNPIPRRDGDDFVKKINDQGGAGVASAKMLPGTRYLPFAMPPMSTGSKPSSLISALASSMAFASSPRPRCCPALMWCAPSTRSARVG